MRPSHILWRIGDMERGWASSSLQSTSSSNWSGSSGWVKIHVRSWKNVRSKMADEWRGNKYSDPRSTEFRTKLNFILVICLNKINTAERIAQLFSSELKSDSWEPWSLRGGARAQHRGQPFFQGWVGLWAGFQFSAPAVKSGECLRFRFAEF